MVTLKRAPVLLGVALLLAACGGVPAKSSADRSRPSPSPAAAAPTGGATVEPGTAQAANGPFTCGSKTGGNAAGGGQLTAVRAAQHPGYDRITFEFQAASGVPAYRLEPQSAAAFNKDPSGLPLNLAGAAGLKVVFQNASGRNDSGQTYSGSLDISPGLPVVREVAQVGDFERVLSWAAGLSSANCLRVTELTNPARLAVDVQASAKPAAGTPAELTAVVDRIYHPVPTGGFSAGCEAERDDPAKCPVTPRFRAELHEPGYVNLFCRCQNGDPLVRAFSVAPTAAGGTVKLTTGFSHVVLVITRNDGALLLDDVLCSNADPATSVYNKPFVGC
jgi:hypothetical protein